MPAHLAPFRHAQFPHHLLTHASFGDPAPVTFEPVAKPLRVPFFGANSSLLTSAMLPDLNSSVRDSRRSVG